MVEPEHPKISVREQAKWLGINRSTLYYQAVDKPDEEVRLKHRIDKIYTDHPAYGTRRITAVLRREGWDVKSETCPTLHA
jgi:putative transposase